MRGLLIYLLHCCKRQNDFGKISCLNSLAGGNTEIVGEKRANRTGDGLWPQVNLHSITWSHSKVLRGGSAQKHFVRLQICKMNRLALRVSNWSIYLIKVGRHSIHVHVMNRKVGA